MAFKTPFFQESKLFNTLLKIDSKIEITCNRLRYYHRMMSFCHICYNSHIPEFSKFHIHLHQHKGQYLLIQKCHYNRYYMCKYNVYCDWYIVLLRHIYALDKHRSGYMFDHFHDNQDDMYTHKILNNDK